MTPARKPPLLLVVALFLVLLAGAGYTGAPRSATAAPPNLLALAWSRCGAFECATLSVPLDYANPTGRQVELALIRQPAQNSAARIGSLVMNPGGPGVSGVDFLRRWAPTLAPDMRARFDIVSFDPRGVGASIPSLQCHEGLQGINALDPVPLGAVEWRPVQESKRTFSELCAQRGGDILPFMGTENVARDLDEVRKALDEEKLTYLGYSYGTVLGSVYADLFPQNVRAMVLDGPVDLRLPPEQMVLEQARGFEGALSHFLANCVRIRCIAANPSDPAAAIAEFLRRARMAPVPAPGADRPAGGGEVTLALVYSLYSDRLWGGLATAIDQGLAGNGTALVRLVDLYHDRNADGTYKNSYEMNQAVNCLDYEITRDPSVYEAIAPQYADAAPTFGVFNLMGWVECAYWPAPPLALRPPTASGAPPILIVGSTGDPATPYKWAQSLSQQLQSARLLTNYGDGHTAYMTGVACIDAAVNAYLAALTLPAPGAACGDPARVPVLEVTASVSLPAPPPPPPAPAPPPATSRPPVAPSPATTNTDDDDDGLPLLVPVGVAALVLLVASAVFIEIQRQRASRRPL